MKFAILTLFSALTLAVVADWFAIVGIMSIFAGQPVAALCMGIVLALAKLITTSWLYRNWKYASWKLKAPLIYFTIALMTATSIGVFGFLTKSHLEQGAATVDNSAKIERLDEQIAREKATIADNEKIIGQLDSAINSYIGKDNADRALAVRRSQAPQRKQLRADVDAAQKKVDEYSDAKFKLTSEVRALQLEVGPIRYIAELFYGDDGSDTKKIEAAVKIFTLLIVSTLDPLAVILLIAANHTILRLQNEEKEKREEPRPVPGTNNWQAPENDTREAKKTGAGPQQAHDYPSSAEIRRILPAEILPDVSAMDDQVSAQSSFESDKIDEEVAALEIPHIEQTVRDWPSAVDSKYNERTEEVTGTVINETTPEIFTEEAQIVNEETETEVEKFGEITIPPSTPVILSPPVSRINFGVAAVREITPDVESEIRVQAETSVLTKPHESTVLREMLGNQPHFIPQKINEEKAISPTSIGSTGPTTVDTTASTETQGTVQNEITETIQTVEEDGQGQVQETHDTAGEFSKEHSHDKPAFPALRNKYPISLSWLKEFKGN